MTPERREQAEKEVREKLGWWIVKNPYAGIGDIPNFNDADETPAVESDYDADSRHEHAYNLLVSQTIALAEAQERIAELEKALGLAVSGEKIAAYLLDKQGMRENALAMAKDAQHHEALVKGE